MFQLPIDSNSTNQVNHQEIQWQIDNASRMFSGGVNTLPNTGTMTTSQGHLWGEKRLISVVVKDVTVEISYRQSPNFTYTVYHPNGFTTPDTVWKEVYGLKDGVMSLLKVVSGKHNPAHHVPESFEFDDEK